jgi:hypothetical protein
MSGNCYQSYVQFSRLVTCLVYISLFANIYAKKFQDATLEFSQAKTPTISKVLPLYKMIQQHLEEALKDPDIAKRQIWPKVWT